MDKLSKITKALSKGDKDDQTSKKFFAEDELTLADIKVEVNGVGNIEFPLTEDCIQRLVSVSSKAKFGLREQTLLDENVRKTNEIASEKLSVTIEPNALSRVLNKIRGELGLAENSNLTAHLHNMLIYSRGHFFEKHQDTEKMDNMIATLIIVLPSSHIGGHLIIQQGDEKHAFSTENINDTRIKCIAFYADCIHEVKTVQHGNRVALTYNLALQSPVLVSDNVGSRNLKIAIKEYFDETRVGQPLKLVYFLNHEYTEFGLRWNMLKGGDRTNANAILKVANELNLVPHLALMKIEESYSTSADPYEKDPEPDEMLNSKVTLSYWIDAFNKKLTYDELEILDSEYCYNKDTEGSFKAYKTEYEGYQGNWGGNMTLWYRRAGIVLWEQSNQVPMNFYLNNQNAIKELLQLTRSPGNEKQVSDVIQKAKYYLQQKCQDNEDSFAMLAQIAIYLNDMDAAYNMLSKFPRTIVSVATAESLAKLQTKFGVDWCIRLLNTMVNYQNRSIDKIDFFMKIFVENNGSLQIAELLLDKQIIEKDEYVYHYYAGLSLKLPERFVKLDQLFKACAIVQNVPILHKIIQLVSENPSKYRIIPLVDLFLSLKNEIPSNYYINFQPLKTYLLKSVNDELALGEHSDDDWSITNCNISCDCELCKVALMFLNSKTDVSKRWPLREQLRNHVSNRLRCLRIPLNITVERSGSPHKLIIEKDVLMHQKAHDRYRDIKNCQENLISHTF